MPAGWHCPDFLATGNNIMILASGIRPAGRAAGVLGGRPRGPGGWRARPVRLYATRVSGMTGASHRLDRLAGAVSALRGSPWVRLHRALDSGHLNGWARTFAQDSGPGRAQPVRMTVSRLGAGFSPGAGLP